MFRVMLYGERHFSEYPWQCMSYKVCRPYQAGRAGWGHVTLTGVSSHVSH